MSDRYRTEPTLHTTPDFKADFTIYRDNQRIGVIDTAEDAAHIVKILNTVHKLAAATDHHDVDDAVMELVLELVLEVGQPEDAD